MARTSKRSFGRTLTTGDVQAFCPPMSTNEPYETSGLQCVKSPGMACASRMPPAPALNRAATQAPTARRNRIEWVMSSPPWCAAEYEGDCRPAVRDHADRLLDRAAAYAGVDLHFASRADEQIHAERAQGCVSLRDAASKRRATPPT